jgi:hypothetical protein
LLPALPESIYKLNGLNAWIFHSQVTGSIDFVISSMMAELLTDLLFCGLNAKQDEYWFDANTTIGVDIIYYSDGYRVAANEQF